MLEITPIPCLRDNYAYLLRCKSSGFTAVVDPSEGAPLIAALDGRLDCILNTHHHWDHTGGNEALLEAYPSAEVFGHSSDRGRIPGQTQFLDDGETIEIGLHKARILFIPGHTTGAIAYHFRDDLFTGDTLFIAGCGRVFEGTAPMMHASLQRLAALSPQTRVWVGHEYTLANLSFAQAAEPNNKDLASALARAKATREKSLATVPSSIELELKINPFLRAKTAGDFGRLRSWKDKF